MRRETKFTFPNHQLYEVKNSLIGSSFLFDTPYPDRRVCSLYFDSWDAADYCDNLAGISERCKLRIRWYEDNAGNKDSSDNKFHVELKLRKNKYGEKLIHTMELPSELAAASSNIVVNFILLDVPAEFRPLIDPCSEIILGVSYSRHYYVSRLMDLRCTIDTDLKFWDPRDSHTLKPQQWIPEYPTEHNVLELKFPADLEKKLPSNFEAIFPGITSGRHSKYAIGCSMVHG
jgi:hypothetical protein